MRRFTTLFARLLLVIILIIIGSLAFGQSEKKIRRETLFFKSYVKTATTYANIDCRELYVEYFFNKRRFILKSDIWSHDLKIIKRKREYYIAENKEGVIYTIHPIRKDGEVGWLILPNENSVGAAISRANLCD